MTLHQILVPGALQHAVLLRRTGTVPNSEFGTIPGLQRIMKTCCAAPGKRGRA